MNPLVVLYGLAVIALAFSCIGPVPVYDQLRRAIRKERAERAADRLFAHSPQWTRAWLFGEATRLPVPHHARTRMSP